MSTLDRAARSELLQTVQAQEEKIKRYETRLRDLVVAYRTLTKEKATLEETVKALSVSKAAQGESASDAESASEAKCRVEALSQSLASLTEEKRQMEASYVSDRKKLLKEQEEAVLALRREIDSTEIVRRELQRENGDLKARLREQRLQAERADADQACMLRELQSLLTKERSAREQLEFEAEELRERLQAAAAAQKTEPAPAAASPDLETHQRCIRDLRNELEQLRGRQCATEGPLEALQAELVAMKAEHRVALHRELQRANDAEHRLAEFTQQHEERVSCLEARLTELSLTLGSYERTRAADQTAISKLRDRIAQLDRENSALASGAEREKSPESGCSADSLEEEEEAAAEANPVELSALLGSGGDSNLHRACREEVEQLREEFERYKLKAQSVLMKQQALARGAGASGVPLLGKEEAERLQQQVGRLKERLRTLQEELSTEERQNKRAQAAMRRAGEEKAAAAARELEAARRAGEQRAQELADELARLRNRTLALLAEKDDEIGALRSEGGAGRAQALLTAASMNALFRQSPAEEPPAAGGPPDAAPSPALASCTLIHCQQERARLGCENRQLREARRQLEADLRESGLKERELAEQTAELQRAARLRDDSNAAHGALDLEYLKNVVLRYATTSNAESKRSMLRAIATILHFSPKEVLRVEHYNNGGWFSSAR